MILLVEDDVAIGRSLAQGLGAKGFAVRWLRGAGGVADALAQGDVAVAILDLGLPDGDGMALCRQIRADGHTLPILMLTARATLDDRLEGFDAGADDYLPKPFAFAELLARVGVLARRAAQLAPAPATHGALSVDLAAGQARWRGTAIALEPKGLVLLAALTRGRGGTVSRQRLIDAAWGPDAVIADNTLDVAISALRRRLADCAPDVAVRAAKGQGYYIDVPDIIP